MSETWGECGVPIHSSVDTQATTYSLLAVHEDLVRGFHPSAYCQVAPPSGSRHTRELVGEGRNAWGSVRDISRK
jgi:hypothetical protein